MFGLDKIFGMKGGGAAAGLGGLARVSRKPSSAPPSSAPPSSAPPSPDPSYFDPGSDQGFGSMIAGYSGAGMGPPSAALPSMDPGFFDPFSDPGLGAAIDGYSGAGMGQATQMPGGGGIGGFLGGLAQNPYVQKTFNALGAGAAAAARYGQPQMMQQPMMQDPMMQPYQRNPYADMTDEELAEFLRRAETDPSFVDAMLTKVE